MGVITVKDIDYGQIFGPFPTHLSAIDPAYLIGMLTRDKAPEGVILKVDVDDTGEGMKTADWLPRVSAARNEQEQNMEAYLKYGRVYYRTLRIVKGGEQLLVWYSKDLTQMLGLPELPTSCMQDDQQYRCPHCSEMFDFPFPLRAHLKFQCSFTSGVDLARIISKESDTLSYHSVYFHGKTSGEEFKDAFQGKSQYMLNLMTNNTKPKVSSKRQSNIDDTGKIPIKKYLTDNMKSRKVSSLSHSIDGLVGKRASQCHFENGLESLSDSGSAFRKVEKPHNISSIDHISSGTSLPSFPTISNTVSSSLRASSPQTVLPTCLSSALPDLRSFVTSGAHIPLLVSSLKDQPSVLSFSSQPCSSLNPRTSRETSIAHSNPSLPVTSRMGIYMPQIPLMSPPPSFSLHSSSLIPAAGSSARRLQVRHSAYADQIPPGLLEMCRATIPTVGPLTESFAANIRNNDTIAKQALFADRHISSLAFLKSSNPMVEKLLQCTNPTLLTSPVNALNLSQNWCAKCNATFRMTSDLVYHMRSHHKRDFDPIKRKREEKLKCGICNETFRERHHLTRHMSSHA
ncbi:unnamed protein product [Candidula unifasciata]|uniref:C2H2-type domain-containing protein n=1 Tax=Candidula unifasciata TaxID=100452 RepID=A0A8S3Z6U0_9EUPU|nr:unnamed protein product [Candidula unifasciata]